MRSALLWAGGLLMAAAVACGPPLKGAQTAEEYREEARLAYDEAVAAYVQGDWEMAVRLLSNVRRDYAYTRFARLAELRLADAAFRQEKYAEAAAAYKTFAREYPSDEEVPYARYRVVEAQFLQAGSSIFQPPLEERDLASVRGAYSSVRSFLRDFPDYPEAEQLQYMLAVVTGVLARHELYVARFYLNQGQYEPAIERAKYSIARYPGSGLEPEAVVLMGETYLKMNDKAKAQVAFQRVLSEYPASPFVRPAQQFLTFLGVAP